MNDAPGALEWEDLVLRHIGFIHGLIFEKLNEFYDLFRWQSWQDDVILIRDLVFICHYGQ
jgi:hypothetical protein